MIQKVYEIGIKPTAKLFNTIPKTVRKWKKRYEKDGIRGLEDKLRAPKNIPHKVKSDDKEAKRAIEIKKRLKTFSAKRLKEMFKFSYSPNTLHRIFKEEVCCYYDNRR